MKKKRLWLIGALVALGPLIGAPFAHAASEFNGRAGNAQYRSDLRPLRALKNSLAIGYTESIRFALSPLAKVAGSVKKNRGDASHHCGSCGLHNTN